jgi:hypothetical protein
MKKNKAHTKLIKLQNQYGKEEGKKMWAKWKQDLAQNGQSQKV